MYNLILVIYIVIKAMFLFLCSEVGVQIGLYDEQLRT